MGRNQVLLLLACTTVIACGAAGTTTPSNTSGRSTPSWHHVCVPCSAEPIHNKTGLSFTRNESVFSGGCATQIHAGVSKFSETARFSTNAFSVLHLLECITEALSTNGTFFCKDDNKRAVECDHQNHTVIAFCHNTTLSVEPHAPLAAIEWAAALYTAITLAGIFTFNYVY
ncbi:GP4 protein [Free State vervet virus]|uniref:GP4 protein n=1 Tax=Free State vervet virus TaxID=1737586 RepID=A0A159D6W9_9NIDO|nr:GP4 protein [Free State vervet virus]ALS54301.1 GP4 protein [Free State vervet virus]